MMATIEITFSREMAIAAIDGRKVATTRSEAKGKIGDVFVIPDPRSGSLSPSLTSPLFRLIDIQQMGLSIVCCRWYRCEGSDSPEAFEKTWRALHRGHFTTGKLYYMHIFGRIT
jgi:hypothetical protein